MGISLGKTTTAASSCWLDLPPEIAGEILFRLPTHDDRLSFKSVCHGWRLAACRQQDQESLLPPAAPCINLGGGMYQSIVVDDNGTKQVRRFGTPTGFRAGANFGGFVLYEHKRSRRCFLRNPCSDPSTTKGLAVPCRYARVHGGTHEPRTILLQKHGEFVANKIIVCSPSLVVALTSFGVAIDASADFACFRPETTAVLWKSGFFYKDMAFHRGKIFAVDSRENLFSHWLAGECPADPAQNVSFQEAPSHSRTEHVIKEQPATTAVAAARHHLVTSSDKRNLLMVRWSIPTHINCNDPHHHTINLQVFKADLDNGRWSEVKDLDGQVLFVGPSGSEALMVEGLPKHYYGHTFQGGNHVFLLGHEWASARRWANGFPCRCLHCKKLANNIPTYCVYDMVTGETSLVSLYGGHGSMKSSKAQWFFPSE